MRKAILGILVTTLFLVGCAGSQALASPPTTAGETSRPTAEATSVPTQAPTPEPTAEPPTPEPTPAQPILFQPGEEIVITSDGEDWATVTVTKVKERKRYEGEYSDDVPERGNIYIEAYITYVALTDGVDYNPFDWQVFADGVAVDSIAFVTEGPTPELSSGTLPEGRKAAGWVVYEVPTEGQVLLSYGNTFSDEPPVFEVELRDS